MPNPPCPYCGAELPREPKRRSKCPDCGKTIEVRPKQNLFPSKVLTQKQAGVLTSFAELQEHGVTAADYHAERERRAAEFGGEPLPGDVVWALWQEVAKQTIEHPDRTARIYTGMAYTAKREGRNAAHLFQHAARARLLDLKRDGMVTHVEVLSAQDDRTCEACRAAGERGPMPIDEALEDPKVPNPECTSEHCRCGYAYSIERDSLPPKPLPETPAPVAAEKSGCAVWLGAVGLTGLLAALAGCGSPEGFIDDADFDQLGPFRVGMIEPDIREAAREEGILFECDAVEAREPWHADRECRPSGWPLTNGYEIAIHRGRASEIYYRLGDGWAGLSVDDVVERFGYDEGSPFADWERGAVEEDDGTAFHFWMNRERTRVRNVYCSDPDDASSCSVVVAWRHPEIFAAYARSQSSDDYQERVEAVRERLRQSPDEFRIH